MDGLAKVLDRFIKPPLSGEGGAQIVQCVAIIRLDLDGPAIILNCFIKLPPGGEGDAQIDQRLAVVRVALDGLTVVFHCLFNVPLIVKQRAQIVMGHRAVRVPGQCLLPEGFQIPVHPRLLPRQHAQQNNECGGDDSRYPGQPGGAQGYQADTGQILKMISYK